LLHLKVIVTDETEPTIPDEKSSKYQITGTEPSLPSLIIKHKITTKSKEPQIPEISYTSLRTREPEPPIPTQSQTIYKPSKRRSTITKVGFDGITTQVSETVIDFVVFVESIAKN